MKSIVENYCFKADLILQATQQKMEEKNVEGENLVTLMFDHTCEDVWKKIEKHSFLAWFLFQANFLALFANFEWSLTELTSVIEQCENRKVKLKDITGKDGYIEQKRKYLELICGIKKARQNNNWNELNRFRKFRNKLTHEGGFYQHRVDKDIPKQQISDFLSKYGLMVIGKSGRLTVDGDKFIKTFVNVTTQIFKDILEEIQNSKEAV